MAAEQGVVERLRAEIETPRWPTLIKLSPEDARALLAVVEAAQDVCDDPKSKVPGIMATLRLIELRKALAALHTQASDEGGE